MGDYEHPWSMVSGIEDISPPQKQKRYCPCGTILSQYNPETICYLCQRKYGTSEE